MKRVLPTLVILVLIGVLGVVFYKNYFVKYTYSEEKVDLKLYYEVAGEDDYPVVLEDNWSDYHAKKIGEQYYLTYENICELLNDRFYYGAEDAILCYCLPTTRITAKEGESVWTDSSGKETKEQYQICVKEGDKLYVALDFVRQYTNFYYEAFTEPNRLLLYNDFSQYEEAEITKATKLRASGGVKSKVVCDVAEGTKVTVIERMDNWSKVVTPDAMIGYVENRKMTVPVTATRAPVTDYQEPEYKRTAMDGKVNMVWHSIAGAAGNDTFASRIDVTESVNVVAPTWFTVLNEEGSVESRATQAYVDAAHERDLSVWAVLDNFNGPDGVQQKFLTTDAARSAVISKTVDTVLEMGIEGINVDIEGLTEEYGTDFIEFMRELSIACRNEGIVMSVDNYVPYNFNNHYRIFEQSVFADYVVVMGYDEHYAGSQEPGSVASIGYVTYGIEETLKFVQKDKLINGIPFYSRVWKTTAEGVTSQAYGMNEIQAFIANHNMNVEWNSAAEQYYAEVTEGDATYQIWVEDAESIEKKLEVMQAHNIIGVAEWCLGMESTDVWTVIADYMNK